MKDWSPFSKWDVAPRSRLAVWERLSAPQLFVASFAMLVLLATMGFRWLPGLYTGPRLSWLDSLFNATSAVCVTGLLLEDVSTFFTPIGQLYILALVQIGGLGIISFTSLIIVTLGRRLSLRSEAMSSGSFEVAPHVSRQNLIRDVVRFTFAIEGAGALLLYLLWAPRMGWTAAAWPALFHSISAFCNAGVSTFEGSLTAFDRSPLTLCVIMSLIVVGGLGFLTLEELWLRRQARRTKQIFRVSLHTKLVLSTTVILLVVGAALFALFEWYGVLVDIPVPDRVVNAMFMSATARTAGFNSIDYAHASERSLFLTIILMAIGGSPGSTSGGLKTTTVALIALLAWSRYRGRSSVAVWSRTVPPDSVDRAVGLFVVWFGLVTVAIFLLTTTELSGWTQKDFLDCMFEAVAAFSTAGLHTGMTQELTSEGRGVATVLMFVGRVGPLTFAAALARRRVSAVSQLRYAYEDVVVG